MCNNEDSGQSAYSRSMIGLRCPYKGVPWLPLECQAKILTVRILHYVVYVHCAGLTTRASGSRT